MNYCAGNNDFVGLMVAAFGLGGEHLAILFTHGYLALGEKTIFLPKRFADLIGRAALY